MDIKDFLSFLNNTSLYNPFTLRAESSIQNLTNSLESPTQQPLVIEYNSIVEEAFIERSESWIDEFGQAKTDFQRVCFLLRAIDSSVGRGAERLGLSITKEQILQVSGKSDDISKRYLSYGKQAMNEMDIKASLVATTKAVFYAVTPKGLARALIQRCSLLYQLELFDEAIRDGLRALKLTRSKSEIGDIHLYLGHCYEKMNMPSESGAHYDQALTVFNNNNTQEDHEENLNASKRRSSCLTATAGSDRQPCEPRWKCIRSKAPKLIEVEKKTALKALNTTKNKSSNAFGTKLLSVPNNILRLKYTGNAETGWNMELTQSVTTGDILIIEKPWAMSLWKERTKYCYYCCRRCYNLIPCSNCPHVGFCSRKCLKNAKNPKKLAKDGNKHIYDCQGLCPNIIYDENVESLHTAFNCLAKVPSKNLLEYICSFGPYMCERGHQAFKGGEAIRCVPPAVFDPYDYSSIAFLSPCSEQRETTLLWFFAKAAVFLTYCFYLGGYPMKWFDETDIFFSNPSSAAHPEIIPASWFAACMLYHIQAADINYFGIIEEINKDLSKTSYLEEIGSSIYPTISLINHSCDPNVVISFTNKGVAVVYALQPLHAESEIYLPYKPPFFRMSTKKRQKLLLSHYYFKCECVACQNNWNKDTINKPERLVCGNCKSNFSEFENVCPVCGSPDTVWMYRRLVAEVGQISNLFGVKTTYTLEDLDSVAKLVDYALPFLQKPSFLLTQLQTCYSDLFNAVYGLQTIEPWSKDDRLSDSSS